MNLKNKMEYTFGLIGILSAIFFVILAIIFDGNYNFLTRTVSSLGNGDGKLFFSIGFIIAGCLGIPFYIKLEKSLIGLNEVVRKVVTGLSIVSCLAIALVGVIPNETFPLLFYYFHGTIAFITFVGTSIYIGLYSYLMYKSNSYNKVIPIVGVLVLIFLFLLLFGFLPIVEWIMTILMFSWIILTIIHNLKGDTL